jgi:hypothetical protein
LRFDCGHTWIDCVCKIGTRTHVRKVDALLRYVRGLAIHQWEKRDVCALQYISVCLAMCLGMCLGARVCLGTKVGLWTRVRLTRMPLKNALSAPALLYLLVRLRALQRCWSSEWMWWWG